MQPKKIKNIQFRNKILLSVFALAVVIITISIWVYYESNNDDKLHTPSSSTNEPDKAGDLDTADRSNATEPKDTTSSQETQPTQSQQPASATPQKQTQPSLPAPKQTPLPTPTPLQQAPEPNPSSYPAWPTPQNTGPRSVLSATHSGTLSSTADGQVISNISITGRLVIRHNNVTVRDVRIFGTGTYMLEIDRMASGVCPSNVRIEYAEIDGSLADESDIPFYGHSCGFVFDHGYVHEVGRSSRITNNTTISNSYIHSSRTGDSQSHRGAVGINGGSNNVIYNNVLKCSGVGCSAAIPNYGDFAPVTDLRIEHNLLSTTAHYCAYGGSLPSKPYPEGSNIDFINNHFSTEFNPECGRSGPITGYAWNVRGNDWIGNVWHETGVEIPSR